MLQKTSLEWSGMRAEALTRRTEWIRGGALWTAAVAALCLLVASETAGGEAGERQGELVPWEQDGAGGSGGPSYPRLANIYFPSLQSADLERLAEWDLLVLAKRGEHWYRDELTELRDLNPRITLLAHMAVCYHGDYAEPPINGDMRAELYANDWWLTTTSGERVEYGINHLLNVTTSCPPNAEGQRLCDWLPEYIAERLGPGGLWDGVYLDCAWDRVSWMNNWIDGEIDCDGDGVPDDSSELNEEWRAGMEIIVSRLRELVGDEYIVATNGNNTHYEACNGSTRENFPYMHGDWYHNIANEEHGYIAIDTQYRDPTINIINTIWSGPVTDSGPVETEEYRREFMFTFTSTLVYGDGYFSFDGGQGVPNHAQMWWHELYDLDLGTPLGRAEGVVAAPGERPGIEHADMIKLRRFGRGAAVVNPTECGQTVMLGGVYYPTDSWNGEFYPYDARVDRVTVDGRSGAVLAGSGKLNVAAPEVSCWQGKRGVVHVDWPPVPGAGSYAVYRADVSGDLELVDVVQDNEYVVLSVEDPEAHEYCVAAIDENGCEGRPSCPMAVVTQLGSDPSVPSPLETGDGALALGEEGTGGRGGESAGIDGPAGGALPRATALHPCYPNPAREAATISFDLAAGRDGRSGPVRLAIFDVAGRRVRTLLEGPLPPGPHDVTWDARSGSGARVASGCYFTVLTVGESVHTGKIIITD